MSVELAPFNATLIASSAVTPTWKVRDASHPYEKRDASTIVFKVKVPKRGEASVKYTYNASWK